MFKLVWDKIGEKLFEAGVSRGVLYKKKDTDPYGKGVVWNGLTNVNESPEGGEPNDMWADGIKYASIRSAENFKATIEAYTYPDEFESCDGSAEPVKGLKISGQKREPFGFCYRSDVGSDEKELGEFGYRLHLVYGATASPSSRSHATIAENPDAEQMSWDVNTIPVPVNDLKPTAHLVVDSWKVDEEKLLALENVLYGSDGPEAKEARMPLPDEVLKILKGE